ncbi:MAG: hypothetical protein KGJ62_03005 [Armatimonadetes bacterium]|nr:hypothetical protein [Armatimonadota bacterium]MDE2207180.1 hypothetical protein [Armatimonadota bacterium]
MTMKEIGSMDEGRPFVVKAHCGLHGFAELCEPFGTRRSAGYKWASRFAADGFACLAQRSDVPGSGPHRTREAICALLCAQRRGATAGLSRSCLRHCRACSRKAAPPAAQNL